MPENVYCVLISFFFAVLDHGSHNIRSECVFFYFPSLFSCASQLNKKYMRARID